MEDWATFLPKHEEARSGGVHKVDLPLDRAEAVLKVVDVTDGLKNDERRYCMHARLAALRWQPAEALQRAEECAADEKAVVRLRTYVPALAVYGLQGALELTAPPSVSCTHWLWWPRAPAVPARAPATQRVRSTPTCGCPVR